MHPEALSRNDLERQLGERARLLGVAGADRVREHHGIGAGLGHRRHHCAHARLLDIALEGAAEGHRGVRAHLDFLRVRHAHEVKHRHQSIVEALSGVRLAVRIGTRDHKRHRIELCAQEAVEAMLVEHESDELHAALRASCAHSCCHSCAHTSSASASAGITSARTNEVTSTLLGPDATSCRISESFAGVERTVVSFCRPSRGATS